MLVVANKADLEKNRQVRDRLILAEFVCQRVHFGTSFQVSRPECENMAKQLKTPFIECSAKNRMNVDQAFYELVRLIRKFQAAERPIAPPGSGSKDKKSKALCNLL